MKKLTLDLSSFEVESFETIATASEWRGTVRGYETQFWPCAPTDLSICWGDCGGQDSVDWCSPPGSQTCTYNPNLTECNSYAVQCEPSMVPTNCPSDPTCYGGGCRDSLTAC
jgi:hypothetical protein